MSNPFEKEFESEARPVAEALRDYILREGAAFGVTDVKIAISAVEKQTNAVEKGDVVSVLSGKKSSVSVVLYAGDKVLSFNRNTLDLVRLEAAALENMKIIHLAPEAKERRLLEKERVHKGPVPNLDLFDPAPADQRAMVDYAKAVECAALAEKGVKGTRSVSVTRDMSFSFTLATNGLVRLRSSTRYGASASVVAEDKKGMQIDGEANITRYFSDLAAPQELGAIAARNALARLGATQPPTAVMPVVLSHDAAETFFSILYAALDGATVHKGDSFFKDKVGQSVTAPAVTLIDDPFVPRGHGSSTVDVFGLKREKTVFIENGVLKRLSAGLSDARRLGIEPAGSTNSSVLPGLQTPEEMIADIKEGIYIKDFNGGSVNVNNGTHSREAYGVMIRDGKITGEAVDGFVVSGNLREMFMNVALANDTPRHPSPRHALAAPTTRINGVTIAGK